MKITETEEKMDEWQKISLNIVTIVAWAIGIGLTLYVITRRKKMQEQMGISAKTYLSLVVGVEILYTTGVILILTAMGINVMQHLVRLEFQRAYTVLSQFDHSTIRLVGVMGWVGFFINMGVSFVTPVYLLIAGGDKLHPRIRFLARTEIWLEIVTAVLIFITLKFG